MTSHTTCARCREPVTGDCIICANEVFHSHCWRSPTEKPQPVCPVCLEPIEQPHGLIHEHVTRRPGP